MEVEIKYLLWLKEELRKINHVDLKDIIWKKDGMPLRIDPSILEKFSFYGLNNVDFITTGFYLTEHIESLLVKDAAGGVHDEGLGWNPHGVFCGECSNMTCEGCPMADQAEET